jgi:hypothetical protein
MVSCVCNNGAVALNSLGQFFDNLNRVIARLVKDSEKPFAFQESLSALGTCDIWRHLLVVLKVTLGTACKTHRTNSEIL